MRKLSSSGVTLVALTVTIIVLAILVGISLNVVVGDNGLINRAKKVSDDADQVKAKEKLQLELANLSGDKLTDKTYDEEDYINNRLISKDMKVYENFVVVDDWLFEIDRSEPKIKEELGKSTISEDIQIEPVKEISGDYGEASIIARVIYNKGTISKITIGGEDVSSVVNNGAGKFEGTKKVTENGKYTIIAVDTKGKMQIANIDLTELTTDLEIRTKEDMEKFRNDVNSGKTYEGKNVKVMADIDLGLKSNESWEPIKGFKGNFYGNNYKIKNLYINKNEDNQGLFAKVLENTSVKDVVIESGNIVTQNEKIGAIAGSCDGTIEGCENGASVSGKKFVGGIVGAIEKSGVTITGCKNSGEVTSYNFSSTGKNESWACWDDKICFGGIVGYSGIGTKIFNCKNDGPVNSMDISGGIVGWGECNIEKCLNNGEIISRRTMGWWDWWT